MAELQATVALNIGSQRISMGIFKPSKSGGLILEKYESTTILADPAAEAARLPQIKVAISELSGRLGLKKSDVRYAISGQAVFTRFFKLPPIDDGNIDQLVAFEAQQHVPFPIDEVIWDWQLLEAGKAGKEVVLVAIKGDALNEINNVVLESGLKTEEVDAAPMALYNALRYNYPELEETTLLIDIGAKTCNLIYMEGKQMFTRSVAVGGASITTAISKEYKIPFAEAEVQKCTNGVVALNTAHTSQLDEATAALATVIRNALGKLPAEIARTTNYFRSQHGGKAPKKILLAGGGADLPYVVDFFQEKLRLPVEIFNPLKRVAVGKGVNVEGLSTQAHLLGELVGLALRGIDKAAVDIDLVPDLVSHEREVSRKKPYLIAASVFLLLGLGMWSFSVLHNKKEAQRRLSKLEESHAALEKYAKPLEKIAKHEKRLNSYADQLMKAQVARTLWLDVFADLAYNFASDTVWIVDFDPVVGFKKDAGSEEAVTSIQSVIVSDFLNVQYGSTALAKMKSLSVKSEKNKRHHRVSRMNHSSGKKDAQEVNAIRIKGFWRGDAKGWQEVYLLIDKLRENSEFFQVPEKNKLSLILSNKIEEGEYAAPFELVLPLKKSIPAPKREGRSR